MKQKKTLWLSAALLALLISFGKIVLDSAGKIPGLIVDAGIAQYEIRLDESNSPTELTETPDLEDEEMHSYSPSRFVGWDYNGPATSYEDAHIAFDYSTGAYSMGNLMNSIVGITGIISMTIDYTIAGSFDACYLYVDDEYGTLPLENRIDLKANQTRPLTLTSDYFAEYTSSLYFRISVYSSYEGTFILNSLIIAYTCYQD